jgi:uncharacterized membrane protein
MGAQVSMTLRTAETWHKPHSLEAFAGTALQAATRFWFAVAFLGQLLFAFTVASFYGGAAVRGNFEAWNRSMTHGYLPGDRMGNLAVAIHLMSAVIIILAGTIQLIPQVRNRAPLLHRWNGRLYLVTAFTISLAGLYMMWMRVTVGGLAQRLGNSLMAVLIMFCAVMALRSALARDFKTHRRWALRLYLVVSASLFIRAAIFLSLALNRGPFGFDPATLQGPFLTFITFAQYLVPLAVLEIYLHVEDRSGAAGRIAMAASLFTLTLALGAGIFAVTMVKWLPNIQAAYDSRTSMAQALSATMASGGIGAAEKQYHELKAAAPATYNFDEDQLNSLGYQLLRGDRFKDAIRIFQLNVEAYPHSSNTYDSLAEAYMDGGDKPQAVANYQKSLQLNPKNGNAIKMLQKLNVP